MAHPYDDKGFRHYLKFYDFNMDWYEICEPIGFDAAKYVKKQLANRWTRDVEYFAIDGLTFADTSGQRLPAPRVSNPQGDLSEFMDYGLWYLLENRRLKGSEMKVGYKVSRNGVDFKEFELDNRDEDLTDGLTYYKCKLVEVGLVADHFRNLKNTFNAFSDKDFRDQTITPIQSFDYLIKATAVTKLSSWKSNQPKTHDGLLRYSNFCAQIVDSEINDTLTFFENYPNVNNVPFAINNFRVLRALNTYTNVQCEIDLIGTFFYRTTGAFSSDSCTVSLWVVVFLDPYTDSSLDTFFPYEVTLSGNDPQQVDLPSKISFTIDEVPKDFSVSIFWGVNYRRGETGGVDERPYVEFQKMDCKIIGVEKGLNNVIKAVNYTDLIKQGVKWVNTLPVDINSNILTKFNQQVIFNKELAKNNLELYTTNEAIQKSLQEYCSDVEISTQNLQIRQNEGFYENIEIGSFLVIPSEDYNEPYNETYLINNYQFGYKNFEQDRSVKGTAQGSHTYSEWLPRNERSDNSKKIEIDFVRDPFEKQAMIDLVLSDPKTSTEKDEKLFVEDSVPVAPNSFQQFGAILLMRWINGNLEILNKAGVNDTRRTVINWTTLGIGSTMQILSGVNVGNYNVVSLTSTVMTLTPISSVSAFSGSSYIVLKYFYTNVQLMTRTTEGFSIAPQDYSNLAYTIKRNIYYWYYYLATATMYCKKDIKNSFFKNFGKLETQLDTETTPVIEDAIILYDDLPTPLVEPITIKAKIVAEYQDVVDYLENYRTKKGFVRIFTPTGKVVKVFPKSFEYTLATNEADIDGEKKYESEFLKIDTTSLGIYVDDAFYDMQGIADWFITKNDYIQLYDKKSNPLSNFYRYDFVILNGIKYNSITMLVEALNFYQWT
jgi:hypothetical protein